MNNNSVLLHCVVSNSCVVMQCRKLGAETMASENDSEFLDATQNVMSDAGDMQLTQLQEQLVATMIENENISW